MRHRIQVVLSTKTNLLIVAVTSSGDVVGWVQAHAAHVIESGFRVEIVGLIVTESARRQGAGRDLVAHAERWAKRLTAQSIVVRSNVKRAESHAFYPALGYAPTKTQVVYRKLLLAPNATGPAKPRQGVASQMH